MLISFSMVIISRPWFREVLCVEEACFFPIWDVI
jgi:hypothetical protein